MTHPGYLYVLKSANGQYFKIGLEGSQTVTSKAGHKSSPDSHIRCPGSIGRGL